ncbi:MAG: HEAT repeat domain-containing protein [Sedimentisphaerales bacterium]
MRTLRFTLVKTIVAVGLLIGLSNAALARPSVYVGVGFGHPGFHHDFHPGYGFYHHPYYFGPPWRCYYPYRGTVIVGGGYWYDRGPDYYVVAPPVVVERPPAVVERQTVMVSTSSPQVVQPQKFDQSTLQLNINLQYKKSELLKQLQMPNKELRREAIDELAGFSFDDNVRCALQNILLSDPDPELRAEAARSFGEAKNANARAALEKARVEDPGVDVRKAADQAIKSIEGN